MYIYCILYARYTLVGRVPDTNSLLYGVITVEKIVTINIKSQKSYTIV